MKRIFVFTSFFVLVSLAHSDDRCGSFVGEIEKYKKETSSHILINKNFPLTDEVIFMYPRRKDFMTRVDTYLKNVTPLEKTTIKTTPCNKLLALSSIDENKNGAIKREVKKILISNFDKALEMAYKKMVANSSKYNFEACNGYGDNATRLIAKYYQSDSEQHIRWVKEAIKQYEECKEGEKSEISTLRTSQQQSFDVIPSPQPIIPTVKTATTEAKPITYDQLTPAEIDAKSKECDKCESFKKAAQNSPEKNLQTLADKCQEFCSPKHVISNGYDPVPTKTQEEECQQYAISAQKSPTSIRWKSLAEECAKNQK